MNYHKYINATIINLSLILMVVFIMPQSVMAVSDTSMNKGSNDPLLSLPLIKTTNSISLKNSKVLGQLGQEKHIEIGNISNKKLIKISGKFIKSEANPSYNPSVMILLTKKKSKSQGIAIAFMSRGNSGIYASRLMIRDKKNRIKEDLDFTFKEGEEFSITIEILKSGNHKIRIGGKNITKTIQTKLDKLSLQIFSAELLISNILVK